MHQRLKYQQIIQLMNSDRGFASERAQQFQYISLLQKDKLEKAFDEEQISLVNREPSQQKCYPKLLSWIGRLCIPCATICPCCSSPLYQQQTGQAGLLSRFGRYIETISPGLHVLNPISEHVQTISLRTNCITVKQSLITSDNVQLSVQSVIFFRIVSPAALAYKLGSSPEQLFQCISEICKSCLRFCVGRMNLQNFIESRAKIGDLLLEQMNNQLKIWGILIEKSTIKEIFLNHELQQALTAVAVAKRKNEAMLIGNAAEINVGQLIKEWAQILQTDGAFQIRYLQTIEEILSSPYNAERVIFLNLTS